MKPGGGGPGKPRDAWGRPVWALRTGRLLFPRRVSVIKTVALDGDCIEKEKKKKESRMAVLRSRGLGALCVLCRRSGREIK